VKETLEDINSHLSIAKGYIAALEAFDGPAWTKKIKTPKGKVHTQIVIQEIMKEIQAAEECLEKMK
jgi:hypothetical protein